MVEILIKKIFPLIAGLIIFAIGIAQVLPGAVLLQLGGTPYYIFAGIISIAAGVLMFMRQREGIALFAVLVLASNWWAYTEIAFSGFDYFTRIAFVFSALLALTIAQAPFNKLFSDTRHYRTLVHYLPVTTLGITAILCAYAIVSSIPAQKYHDGDLPPPVIQETADYEDWTDYGGSLAGQRFSGLTQISPQNIKKLKLAWSYRTGAQDGLGARSRFTATPIKIDNSLFACTPNNVVFALDAGTGAELWRYDPAPKLEKAFSLVCRGVSIHQSGGTEFCADRILFGTVDARLIALDAKTGNRCTDFGQSGEIDLRVDPESPYALYYYPSSPPTVIGDIAIIGGYILDNQTDQAPTGLVRAFDVKTGALRWTWDAGRSIAKTLPIDDTPTPGNPNAWAVFSADPQLGLVYVPTGNSAHDIYGGQRTTAAEKFSTSIVALDAANGNVVWNFQAVHHDVWDYDMPAQPPLLDVTVDGVKTPALIAPTKAGEIFLLDRRTGVPLSDVTEKPVPQGGVSGERLSPTQPHTAELPSFGPPDLTETSMWGATPFDAIACRTKFLRARYDGRFTPPSLGGSIAYPGTIGALNWGSVSVDPHREIMVVNTSWMPSMLTLVPRDEADALGAVPIFPDKSKPIIDKDGGILMAQAGADYAVKFQIAILSPLGFPCHAPPWGMLSAVDLKTKKRLWSRPIGTTADTAPFGLSLPLGIFNIGGSVTTASGLVFIGATTDGYFRAFDLASGKILWAYKLPAGGQATPMTYQADNGKQYVVIAAGGHGSLGTKRGDYILAFAIEE
ncbi:membrane-bound PQQ-dependent dehydrogenase, glucose/quinate/shikimate family [Hyphococcus formosus]|uniref:membrane-bound PQQ-dependent dehydrogenase, glucose/quinate/shikimate family n=1 Tax=Hyphococcus formosus TaxID=3143534 RepID=UPI00398B3C23